MTDVLIITHGAAPTTGLPKNRDDVMMGNRNDVMMGESFRKIPVKDLQSRLHEVISALAGSLDLPNAVGSFDVDALDIELEITAEGQIGLLGMGGKFGGKGSLTLRLKRQPKGGATVAGG
jgi:hypothetical protein